MGIGDVNMTIEDGGASVSVPGAEVQVVIGCSSLGTVGAIIASQNPATFATELGVGPLPEACALSALKGGTIIALKATGATAGAIRKKAAVAIVSSTSTSPIVMTTATHGLMTGDITTIAGHLINTAAVGTWRVIVLSSTTFSLTGSTGAGVGGATGTSTPDGVVQLGSASSTSEITITGTPNDTYYVKVRVVTGFTVGTTGGVIRVSLDAGRTYGPELAVGTATTYAISGTGLTLNFSAGILTAEDTATCGTTEPLPDAAGIVAALETLRASPYATTGWGSLHIAAPFAAADCATIQTEVALLATNKNFTRAIIATRDASPPAAYGGTGESDQTWKAAVMADFAATSADRLNVAAGNYNMASAFTNLHAGVVSFRRPLAFAQAQRRVSIPPQVHDGRVSDGSLAAIVIRPLTDPTDGFVYHDERLNGGLDGARFCSAMTRIKKTGFFIKTPKLMSQVGSVFTMLPLGNVMDNACAIVFARGQEIINADIRLNKNGTIYEAEALAIQSDFNGHINEEMTSEKQISAVVTTVNRTTNIAALSKVVINVRVWSRGYILEEDITIGFANPFAAEGA